MDSVDGLNGIGVKGRILFRFVVVFLIVRHSRVKGYASFQLSSTSYSCLIPLQLRSNVGSLSVLSIFLSSIFYRSYCLLSFIDLSIFHIISICLSSIDLSIFYRSFYLLSIFLSSTFYGSFYLLSSIDLSVFYFLSIFLSSIHLSIYLFSIG